MVEKQLIYTSKSVTKKISKADRLERWVCIYL